MKISISVLRQLVRESLRVSGSERIRLQNGPNFLNSIKQLAHQQCDTKNSAVEAWVYNNQDAPGVRYIKRATYLDLVVDGDIVSTWLWDNGQWNQVETRQA